MTRPRMSTIGILAICGALAAACGDDKNLELTESQDTGATSAPPTTAGTTWEPWMSTGSPTGHPTTSELSLSSGGATDGTFIMPSDGGGTGAVECDVWTQNCRPGEKCVAWAEGGGGSWNATKCVPVMERPRQPGEPCVVMDSGVSGIDDCDLGAMCWDVGPDLMGTCVALCTGSIEMPVCQDPGALCAILNEGVLNLCLERCDPLVGDCQDPADLCLPVDDEGFTCVLDASGDGGGLHSACVFANGCDPGLLCRPADSASECDPNAEGCCEPVCDLTAPDPDSQCTGVGQHCVPFFMPDMAPAGDEDVGVCSVPL